MTTPPWQKPNPFIPKPIPKPSSPTGYTDRLGQPVSVASNSSGGRSHRHSSSKTFTSGGQTFSGTPNTQAKVNQAEAMARATNLARQLRSGAITSEQFNRQMAESGVISANGKIITTGEVKRTGGGSYDRDTGIFSSSEQNIKNVENYARQQAIQENLQKLQNAKKQDQRFQQQSPFVDIAIGNLQKQQQSVTTPKSEVVAGLNKEYGGALGIWKERYFSGQKIDPKTLQKVYADVREKEYLGIALNDINSYVKTDLNTYTINRIDELRKDEDYVRKYNELQARVNAGEDVDKINKELEKYDKERVIDIANKEAENKYNKWFADYSAGKGTTLSKDATKDIIDFNSRVGKKFVNDDLKKIINSVKIGAGFGATSSLIFGALKRAGGKFATGASAGQKVLSAVAPIAFGGYVLYSAGKRGIREQELVKDYGFSNVEAMRIAKNEAMARDLRMTEVALGFTAGSMVASLAVNVGLTKIQQIRVNSEIAKFNKELITNPKLTKQVYTKANLERGYVIRTIGGQKVKVIVTEASYRNILALRQGKPTSIEKTIGVTTSRQVELINQLNKQGYNINRNAEVSKTLTRKLAYQTNEPIGRLQEYYVVVQNNQGFRFKLTKAGKITNIESIQMYTQPNGKLLAVTTKFGTKTTTERFGIFNIRKVSPTAKQSFVESRVKVTSQKQIGKVKIEKGLFDILQLRARRVGSILETIPSKTKLVKSGKINKVSIGEERLFDGGKVSKEFGLFESIGKSPRRELLVNINPTAKAPRVSLLRDMISSPTKKVTITSLFEGKGLIQQQKVDTKIIGSLLSTNTRVGLKVVKVPKISLKTPKPQLLVFGNMLEGNEEYKKMGSILGGLDNKRFSGLTGKPQKIKKDEGIFIPLVPRERTKSSSIFGVIQQQEQDVIIQPIVTPSVIPALTIPTGTVRRPLFDTTSILPPFGWGLGGIETGGGQKGIKKKKKPTGRVAYNPSLGSILLKQKKLKVTKRQAIALGRETFSGFEMRPEIEISNKKKKSIFNIF